MRQLKMSQNINNIVTFKKEESSQKKRAENWNKMVKSGLYFYKTNTMLPHQHLSR